MDLLTFLIVIVVVLFLLLLGMLFYVLKTSGRREHRLMDLLETYAGQLTKLAENLQDLARDVGDIAKRLERLELRNYSGDRGGNPTFNMQQVGDGARVGQSAMGKGLEQER